MAGQEKPTLSLSTFTEAGQCWTLALLVLFLWNPSCQGDALLDRDEQLLSGQIVTLEDEEITIETENGTRTLPLQQVKSFRIDRTPELQQAPQQAPLSIEPILQNQQHLLERIESLAQALAKLEREVLSLRSASRDLIGQRSETPQDSNPMNQLSVLNVQVQPQSGSTKVTGQVLNLTESPIMGVQVDVVIYGGSGTLGRGGGQKTKTGRVAPEILEPGQMGAFSVSFEGRLFIENYEVFPRISNQPPPKKYSPARDGRETKETSPRSRP